MIGQHWLGFCLGEGGGGFGVFWGSNGKNYLDKPISGFDVLFFPTNPS